MSTLNGVFHTLTYLKILAILLPLWALVYSEHIRMSNNVNLISVQMKSSFELCLKTPISAP